MTDQSTRPSAPPTTKAETKEALAWAKGYAKPESANLEGRYPYSRLMARVLLAEHARAEALQAERDALAKQLADAAAIRDTALEIDDFSKLLPGWDSYDGKQISQLAIERAKYLLPFFSSNASPNVAPAGDGSIGFEWELPTGEQFWIDVNPDGSLVAYVPKPSPRARMAAQNAGG